MNERFLSRGKRKDNGEWVEGYLIQGNRTYIVTIEAINYMVVSTSCMASIKLVEVIPETVGRCTGLKEKNGKLIFEGDIVNFVNDDGESSLYVVVWNTSLLSWQVQEISHYVKNDYYGFDELCEFGNTELIGNVYDNLELLEAER